MTIELYQAEFGFSERPFTLSPDPDLLFWTPAHTKAFTVLQYGLLSGAPITVLTGEVGAGKTTLIQALLRVLPKGARVGLISNSLQNRDELLRWILGAFDLSVPEPADHVGRMQCFRDFLLEIHAEGGQTILMIDEAQSLGPEMLEEVRMLTNVNSGKAELLQLVLVGQPELADLLRRPSLRQFAQRVSVYFHLPPMSVEVTRDYVRHRLCSVDGSGDEITVEAIDRIFEESRGVPRLVNKLCDLSLVYAAGSPEKRVTLAIVDEMLGDGLLVQSHTAPFLIEEPVPKDPPPRSRDAAD